MPQRRLEEVRGIIGAAAEKWNSQMRESIQRLHITHAVCTGIAPSHKEYTSHWRTNTRTTVDFPILLHVCTAYPILALRPYPVRGQSWKKKGACNMLLVRHTWGGDRTAISARNESKAPWKGEHKPWRWHHKGGQTIDLRFRGRGC
jgi:hypothetical protein